MIETAEQWQADTLAAVRGMSNRMLVHQVAYFALAEDGWMERAEREMIIAELCDRLRATGFIDPSDNLGKSR